MRLTIWFGGFFFLGWLLFGAAMWFNLNSTLTSERYQTLSRRMGRLQELLSKTQGEAQEDRSQGFSDFAKATGNGLAEVFNSSGSRLYPSPSSAAQTFPWPPVHAGEPETFLRVHSAGQSYWVLVQPFSLNGSPLYLLAAAPEAGNQLVLQRFLAGLLASLPVLLLISSAGGYLMSRKALSPVDQIASSARSISIRNLSERLPVANTGDELQRLAETCNAMLGRLETAVKQIKQFTADASHELRGPMSFARTVAEVALRNPQIDSESRRAFVDIVEEAATAGVLLEDMLTLARADAGHFDAALETLDFGTVVQEACELARPLATERKHTLSVSLASEGSVNILGDFSSLRRLVWILLDNALKYTVSPGSIEVTLSSNAGQATLSVRDNGIGIPEADLPRVFDRFYRADPSRSLVEGSGLGLAIAKWISEIHRADLSISSVREAGTTVMVVFPLCPASSDYAF